MDGWAGLLVNACGGLQRQAQVHVDSATEAGKQASDQIRQANRWVVNNVGVPVLRVSQAHDPTGWQRVMADGCTLRGYHCPGLSAVPALDSACNLRPFPSVGISSTSVHSWHVQDITIRGAAQYTWLYHLVGVGGSNPRDRSMSSQLAFMGGVTGGQWDLEVGVAPFWTSSLSGEMGNGPFLAALKQFAFAHTDDMMTGYGDALYGLEVPLTISYLSKSAALSKATQCRVRPICGWSWHDVYAGLLLHHVRELPQSEQPPRNELLGRVGLTVIPSCQFLDALHLLVSNALSKTGIVVELGQSLSRPSARPRLKVALNTNFDWVPSDIGHTPHWW